jgi:hypothetical protein
MDAATLTEETLIEILLDPRKRGTLLEAMESESGFELPITNKYYKVALRCKSTPEQLEKAVNELLQHQTQNDQPINPLVYHPNISEKVLFDLYDQGRCISALGHRKGPRLLLEKLAEEHAYSEAIVTLVFEYYGTPDADINEFVEFIKKYRDDPMLQWNIENTSKLPENKQVLALSVISETQKTLRSARTLGQFFGHVSELLRQVNKRDWQPQVAAAILGLAIGNRVFEWVFTQTALSPRLLKEWAQTPLYDMSARVVTAAVFFIIALVAKRLFQI